MSDKPDLAALFGAIDAETFLGLEKCSNLDELAAPLALIGAPCATPYGSVGAYCRNGPEALRKSIASLTANIDRHNFDLGGPIFPANCSRAVDCGDLAFDETDSHGNREAIRSAVGKILKQGAVPVVIGGDDSIPIPMLQAFEGKGRFTILQIDAHIDWRQSHMGEELGLSSTMRRASEMPQIERIVQVGARGIGSAHSNDYQDALAWGVHFVTAADLHESGVDAALEHLPTGSDIIVCIDVDALDASTVSGVIGRAPGGLTYHQVLDLIKGAASKGKIAGNGFR